MTDETWWAKPLLVRELRALCKQGYRMGKSDLLQHVPALVSLTVLGGPDPPTATEGWEKRRERLRKSLKNAIEVDIAKKPPPPLEKRDVVAALKLLRLDARQPSERSLQDVHHAIDSELFPDVGREHFRKYRMEQTLEAIADALIAREETAQSRLSKRTGFVKSTPKGKGSSAGKPPNGASSAKRKSGAALSKKAKPRGSANRSSRTGSQRRGSSTGGRPAQTKHQAAPPPTAPTPNQSRAPVGSLPRQGGGRSSRVVRIAGVAFVGALAVGLVLAAAAWLVNRGEPNDPRVAATTSPQERSPIKTRPSSIPSPPTVPPINFTAQVRNWCYCGDSDTNEAQIKIKPRLVNHSSRRIDLRTGANARLVLAIYAGATTDRRWLSPTRPRYRRSGKWLLVPPNAPGDLVSSTSFESHWNRWRLRPHGEYFSPTRYEGDLVFNVPFDLYLRAYNARLAYRLSEGRLYFPTGGAVGQWRGLEDGFNF